MGYMLDKINRKYRYSLILLREFVLTDFKVKYQDSFLGYIWSILKPLFMFAIMYAIFVKVLRVGRGIENWPVALLAGIVMWQFFTDVTTGTLKSIVNNGGLLRKISFPRYIIVISNTVSALITLLINSVVVIIFAIVAKVELSWHLILIVPFLIQLFIFALGIAFFLSAVYVRFRDIKYIWEIIAQAMFYGSAIIFPVSLVAQVGQGWLVYLVLANPVAQSIQDVRNLTISSDVPSLWTISSGNVWLYLIPVTISLVAFIFGAWFFKVKSPYFAEDV